MAKKEFTKLSIGEESVVGTSVAVTARVPVTDLSVLTESPEKSDTGIIIGRRTDAGQSLDAIGYSQDISSILTANKANWILLKSLMGVRSTPVACAGSILISYKGSANSCKLIITGTTITAKIGSFGGEEIDTHFGTSGVLTLASQTVTGLVTAINAFTDYEAVLTNGLGTASVSSFVNVGTRQAAGAACPVILGASQSDMYVTIFKPNYTDGENVTASLLTEGVGDNVLGIGCAVDSAEFSAEMKGKATVKYTMKALKALAAQAASGLSLTESDLNPMKFNDGQTFISGIKFSYVKSHSLTVSNNISDDEGWAQGSLYKNEHNQGKFQVTGTITLKLTPSTDEASSEKEAKKIASDLESSLLLEYLGREISASHKEECIIDLPKVQYTGGSKSAGTNNLEQSLEFTAVDVAELLGDVVTIYLIGEVTA